MHILLNAINFINKNFKKAKKQNKLNVMFIISDDGEYYDSHMNKISHPYNKRRSSIEYEQKKPEYSYDKDGAQEDRNMPVSNPKLVPQDEKMKIEDTIKLAGYAYDFVQNIFYSRMDAWQRKYGYCQLYDEACAPLNMIIDCEPIYFDYDNKHWLIEFWKGQYGMTSGCEVGVYSSKWPNLNIPGVFNGTFYKCADDDNLLDISYTLYRNGNALFNRSDRHWWLTGFKLGEFIEPNELSMDIKIIFKNSLMQNAFIGGLKNAGYKSNEIRAVNNIIQLTFGAPRTKQPYTRTEELELFAQQQNKLICKQFQSITKGLDNIFDKIYAVKQDEPEIYKMIFNFGKERGVFDKFDVIKNALKFFIHDKSDFYYEDEQTPQKEDELVLPSVDEDDNFDSEQHTAYDEYNEFQPQDDTNDETNGDENEMNIEYEDDNTKQEDNLLLAFDEKLPLYEENVLTDKDIQKIEEKINAAGFAYDSVQDIFYSTMNAWQRQFGYCRLYDEASAPLSIIIDCEPIYFDYDNQHWLIEFWKGQYGMTAGGEVGVYISSHNELDIPNVFKGMFYEAVDDDNMLEISYTLYKNDVPLFRRGEKHWWLTGFVLGGFSHPSELKMDIKIAFKNSLMQSSFIRGLKNAGYKSGEIRAINNVVYISFINTHTVQPFTRNKEIDSVMQAKNKLLCDQYNNLTKGFNNVYEKINALKYQAPDIYDMIFNIGKIKQIFNGYEKIRKYL